jgi:hypothetical protein
VIARDKEWRYTKKWVFYLHISSLLLCVFFVCLFVVFVVVISIEVVCGDLIGDNNNRWGHAITYNLIFRGMGVWGW